MGTVFNSIWPLQSQGSLSPIIVLFIIRVFQKVVKKITLDNSGGRDLVLPPWSLPSSSRLNAPIHVVHSGQQVGCWVTNPHLTGREGQGWLSAVFCSLSHGIYCQCINLPHVTEMKADVSLNLFPLAPLLFCHSPSLHTGKHCPFLLFSSGSSLLLSQWMSSSLFTRWLVQSHPGSHICSLTPRPGWMAQCRGRAQTLALVWVSAIHLSSPSFTYSL